MKLIVQRDQTTSTVPHFRVSFQLELSKDEIDLVRRYGQITRILGEITGVWRGYNVFAFQAGAVCEVDNVRNALAVEEKVKQDCIHLKNYVETAYSYGGTEEFVI